LNSYTWARDPGIWEGNDVKRLAAVAAVLALVLAGASVTTASAAPTEGAQNDFAWMYQGVNYTGADIGYGMGDTGYYASPWPVNSVINQTTGYGGGWPLCGYTSQGKGGPYYAFKARNSYNYVGSPFSSSDPMVAFTWGRYTEACPHQ
jgi:hypothetical protein